MSESANGGASATRPPQVTVAGWVTIVGSAFLVLGRFDAITRLRSIDSRESIAEALKRPPFDTLDMGVDGALSALHTIFVVAGALGAAACVLGWFVLQRHKQARLALSVVAVPLFVSGFFSGSLAASLVAVSAMLLWSGPARDWFAGRPVRQSPLLLMPPAPPSAPAPPPPSAHERVDAPSLPTVEPGVPSTAPAPYAGFGAPRPTHAPLPARAGRPPALLAAVIITWVASAAVLVVFGVTAAIFVANPSVVGELMDQQPRLARLGLSENEVRQVFYAMALVFCAWALVAAVLALLLVLRVAWARPALIVSAITSGLLSCMMAQAAIPVVTAVAGMMTAYLLLRPEVGRWVNRR